MNIREFFSKKEVKPEIIKKTEDAPNKGLSLVNFARTELPVIVEKRQNDFVFLGENHYYPQFLKQLVFKSAIHNAIITGKAQMQAGKGFLINGNVDKASSEEALKALPSDVQNAYNAFIANKNTLDTLTEVTRKISLDYQIQGAYALEIVWSLDFSKIVTIKHVEVDKICPGKYCNGYINEFYFCENWANYKRCKVTKIQSFDSRDEVKQYSQLIYVKRGGLDYFGTPAYIGAINWINIDVQMGVFHANNISNAFAPSLVLKYYDSAITPEKQHFITQNFKTQYKGAENAGKALMFFSKDKDQAPDIQPLEMANLDKQYIALASQAVQQILTGHKVTSPELFGIATPGKLGSSSLEDSFNIYDNTVIEPDRNVIEEVYNNILKINKIPITIAIEKFSPFGVKIVDKSGLPILAVQIGVGGTQSIIAILTDTVLTIEQKKGTLITLFGLDQGQVDLMLAQPIIPTTNPNPTA